MIQKQKEEDPSASASQQEASQSGKWNTYLSKLIKVVGDKVLLHSIRTIFTARFKNKRKKIHSRQHRSKKLVNRVNQTLTACSIPFAQYLTHDSKIKGRRSTQISIAARSESIRQIKYLPSAQFHSHNIHRMIQNKRKKMHPNQHRSKKRVNQ